MKKLFAAAGLLALSAVLAGCGSTYTPTGMGTPVGGYAFTNAKYGSHVSSDVNIPPYKVLDYKASGSSTQYGVLAIITWGDGSIASAESEALRKVSGADDVINLNVDTEVQNYCMFFTKVTTYVSGIAVKYDQSNAVSK